MRGDVDDPWCRIVELARWGTEEDVGQDGSAPCLADMQDIHEDRVSLLSQAIRQASGTYKDKEASYMLQWWQPMPCRLHSRREDMRDANGMEDEDELVGEVRRVEVGGAQKPTRLFRRLEQPQVRHPVGHISMMFQCLCS